MRRHLRPAPDSAAVDPAQLHLGRLSFDWCVGRIGTPTGRVEFVLRRDTVDILMHRRDGAGRHVACVDRDQLRSWIRQPHGAFNAPDVEFGRRRDQLMLSLTLSTPHPLPRRVAEQLRDLL